VPERLTALAPYLAAGGREGAHGTRAYRFTVLQGWRLLLLAAYRGRHESFAQALAPVLGQPPMHEPRRAQALERGQLLNVAPGQHWLVTTDAAVCDAVCAALPAAVGSATELSHGRVRVAVSGAEVPALLAKGIAVDLDPAVLGVGQFVQTGLHHVGVLLHRTAPTSYELYLPRTFAVSLWEWLCDAALADGYEVGVVS
jgi:methylglutamate dehydrogenase subunit D